MTSSENPALARIRGIPDAGERGAAAQAWIERGREAIKEAQKIRDEAFRASHRVDRETIDAIAARANVKRNVVVHALRTCPAEPPVGAAKKRVR